VKTQESRKWAVRGKTLRQLAEAPNQGDGGTQAAWTARDRIGARLPAFHSDHMEHAPRFHVPKHAPQRDWCRKAQVKSGILLSDFTRILVVVGRQSHPDPNSASYVLSGRPHRLAVALPRAARGPPWSPLPELLSVLLRLIYASRLWPSVFALSKLLPFCCYHFTLFPFV
jgi:hypothetical protein